MQKRVLVGEEEYKEMVFNVIHQATCIRVYFWREIWKESSRKEKDLKSKFSFNGTSSLLMMQRTST